MPGLGLHPRALRAALLAALVASTAALSPLYLACQLIKPAPLPPLLGCPSGTLFVSATDARADFASIQAAVESL
jgi:hypothetical protein